MDVTNSVDNINIPGKLHTLRAGHDAAILRVGARRDIVFNLTVGRVKDQHVDRQEFRVGIIVVNGIFQIVILRWGLRFVIGGAERSVWTAVKVATGIWVGDVATVTLNALFNVGDVHRAHHMNVCRPRFSSVSEETIIARVLDKGISALFAYAKYIRKTVVARAQVVLSTVLHYDPMVVVCFKKRHTGAIVVNNFGTETLNHRRRGRKTKNSPFGISEHNLTSLERIGG